VLDLGGAGLTQIDYGLRGEAACGDFECSVIARPPLLIGQHLGDEPALSGATSRRRRPKRLLCDLALGLAVADREN